MMCSSKVNSNASSSRSGITSSTSFLTLGPLSSPCEWMCHTDIQYSLEVTLVEVDLSHKKLDFLVNYPMLKMKLLGHLIEIINDLSQAL